MPTVHTNGAQISYSSQGSGPALLLLPGLGCPRSIWQPQVEHFSASHQVITVDPRGVGASSPLHGTRDILQRQAADLVAVLDAAGAQHAVVCGVSYGGVLAQRFALDAPDRVSALVTVDSFAETKPRSLREAANLALLYATGWLWLFPRLLRPGIRRQYARWPSVAGYMDNVLQNLRRWETVKIRYAINHFNAAADLAQLPVPVLSVSADHPALTAMGRRIADAAGNGRFTIIQDSFDPSNLCQPEMFNQILNDFLETIHGQQ